MHWLQMLVRKEENVALITTGKNEKRHKCVGKQTGKQKQSFA